MDLDKISLEIKKLALPLTGDADSLIYAETLAALYHAVMNVRPRQPDFQDRDRLITGRDLRPVRAAALASAGYFPQEQLPEIICMEDAASVPGLDAEAALPGEGLKLAVDCALEARSDIKIYRTFALIDQTDCLSGMLWENAIRAGENMLEDLTVILCRPEGRILPGADNICAKFSAFGFDTFSVSGKLSAAVAVALQLPRRSVKPCFVCCDC